jgi:Outer membrane protein/protective antigen OMA87
VFAQQDSIESRMVLVGDAGSLVDGKARVIDAIRRWVPLDEKTSVVYLGDNLYHDGLPDDQHRYYNDIRSVLDSQVNLLGNTKAKGYMIPGNHDWDNGAQGGYAAILREVNYVDGLDLKNFFFYPKDGCPGPVEVSISPNVTMIVMDSQWWLTSTDKPGIESDCPNKSKEEVLAEISDILAKNSKKLIVFACHHPFVSNGIHGGYFGIKQHIFPFTDIKKYLYIPMPVIGSIYPISRSVFGSPQDLKHPTYVNMSNDVRDVIKEHPHVIYAAGHEHTLQLLHDSSNYYVVSGAGCKTTRVEDSRKSDFTASKLGFALLEVSKAKNVKITYYTLDEEGTSSIAFTKPLLNFSTIPKPEDTIKSAEPIYVYKDTALVAASSQYETTSQLQRKLLGENYRKEWSTPVTLKVFNINKEQGGFKITGIGGGKQTKSLSLKDKNGVEWKLRSIDKDPAKAIPAGLRGSLAKDILQDMISAAHPYAPLVVPDIAKAAHIPHPDPKFFFVPDDPSLGLYRSIFANKVCLLEKKDNSFDGSDTKSTPKVLKKMVEDNDHVVDQTAVLRARLLDIMIGDWDRHFDQWRWGVLDTGKGKLYYPIPRDRDQALFYSDGLVMRYATRNRLPFMKGLRYDIPKVNWLGYSARDFDRFFMNTLDAYEWQKTICEFQADVTDTVISTAVRKLPPDVYNISGPEITEKLKSRRDLLMQEGMKYYEFLSKYVNVVGSNKREEFVITGNDTSIKLQVYIKEKSGDTSFLMYSRIFDEKITKEIRLYGFNGDDKFTVDDNVNANIKLRIIGGRGADTFNLGGKNRKYLYDLKYGGNQVVQQRRTINLMSNNPTINDYSYQDYKYQDIKRFPWINVGFNSEDGPLAGVGFWRKTYGFRKEPYATENKLSTLYSFLNNAYQAKYFGAFTDVYRNIDLIAKAEFQNPSLYNFFGLGNETERLPGTSLRYYRTRYKYVAADVAIQKRFFRILTISGGPSIYHYWNRADINQGKILEQPSRVGLDSADVFSKKTFVGGKLAINVNNLNSEIFPTRGINWTNEFTYMNGVSKGSGTLTKYQSDMVVYASLSDPAKLVAVLRFGGGHIFDDKYEYFQALTLGANNYLRGFRKNRFSGSSLLYNSVELRCKLVEIKSKIFPGTLGLVGFNDIGRVWVRNENSKKWHNAYGGGLYFLPFDMFILSATVGRSPEETIFNFTLGTRLNLTF